jgi:hypothetical protein
MQAMDSNGQFTVLGDAESVPSVPQTVPEAAVAALAPVESGGPAGLEPTRYGDWERRGRCIDF